MKKLSISIVIPCYCEQDNLIQLHKRISDVILTLPEFTWKFVFVNDGSTDDTLDCLRRVAKSDKTSMVIDLSRNFGKEIALTAGVTEAEEVDAIICIDADLQHPPELIPELVDEWQKGAEVVVTVRDRSESQPLMRKWGSALFYWFMSVTSSVYIVPKTTDFRLYDKKVIDAFKRMTERDRMFRGIMDWMGFRRSYVSFEAATRNHGKSSYSYIKLLHLAVSSILSFSYMPLKLAGYLGLLITFSTLGILIWMVNSYLTVGVFSDLPLMFLAVANTFLIGVVLIILGLIGLYIGAIHNEVINRPLYIVREKINFAPNFGSLER